MKRKWLILTVSVLGLIPLVGMSIAPLFTAFNSPLPNTSPAPTSSAAVTSPTPSPVDPKQQLRELERGYEAVLKREPNNPTVLEGLVRTRLQLIQMGEGQIASVIEPLELLTQQKPENTEYKVLLGQAQAFSGKREAAAQTYRSILATKPGEIKALQALVTLLMQEQKPEAALGVLQDTLKTAPQANQLRPNSVDVFAVQLLQGDVYASLRRYDEALALYESLNKQSPQDYRPLLGKGLVLKQQGRSQEAQPLLQSAANLAPAQVKDQILKLAGLAPAVPSPSPGSSTPPSASPAPVPTASPAAPSPAATSPAPAAP